MTTVEKNLKKPKNFECYYVRFHQPVPPGEDKEPVSEFRLSSKQTKYLVDSITFSQDGVIVKAYKETIVVPLANVVYCRLSDAP